MNYNNAGFVRRLFATLLELIIVSIVFMIPLYLLTRSLPLKESVDSVDFLNPVVDIINIITYVIVALFLGAILRTIYEVYFYTKFGGNVGKLLSGLKILDRTTEGYINTKTAIYRLIVGYAFSAGFFGLGFFRILRNKDNLAWHDELFDTKVVKTNSIVPGIITFILCLVIFGALALSIGEKLTSLRASQFFIEPTNSVQE